MNTGACGGDRKQVKIGTPRMAACCLGLAWAACGNPTVSTSSSTPGEQDRSIPERQDGPEQTSPDVLGHNAAADEATPDPAGGNERASANDPPPEQNPTSVAERLGPQDWSEFLSAERVQVARLDHAQQAVEEKTLSASRTRQLFRILKTEASYLDGSSRCIFRPGIAVVAGSGQDAVRLLFCFSCSDLRLEGPSGTSSTVPFAPSRRFLLRFFKREFPGQGELAPVGEEPAQRPIRNPWAG